MSTQSIGLTAAQRAELASEQRTWRNAFATQWVASLKQGGLVGGVIYLLTLCFLPGMVGWPASLILGGLFIAWLPLLSVPLALMMLPDYPNEAGYLLNSQLKAFYQAMRDDAARNPPDAFYQTVLDAADERQAELPREPT